MPDLDELRGEVFDVRLHTALDTRKAAKSENKDLAFTHVAPSARSPTDNRRQSDDCGSSLVASRCSSSAAMCNILYDASQHNLTTVNIVMPGRDRLSHIIVCFGSNAE
jgi:hypothetical protein